MQHLNIKSGTVLVYTLILVIIGVFMATVVLNVATELSIEYDTRIIEISLINTIQTKGDLATKYARELNDSWSWFIDVIGCPTSVTMSGSTARTVALSTDIHYLSWSVVCKWTHNGGDVDFYFNAGLTDLQYAEYGWYQVVINTWNQTATFSDGDTTFIDATASYPLTGDNIDDDFDSDDYTVYSTWSIYYPDWYVDNDTDSRLMSYGYVIENTWLYSTFWSNTEMISYIDSNPNNNDVVHTKLGNTSSWSLYLDINQSFRLILYKISTSDYNDTKEIIVESKVTGTWELAWIWYLQDDMSLNATITWSEYDFDFTTSDYALFLENTSTWALLYRIRGEDSLTGSGVYLNALKDDDPSILSYLWSHMLISEQWKLIGTQFEVFGLK